MGEWNNIADEWREAQGEREKRLGQEHERQQRLEEIMKSGNLYPRLDIQGHNATFSIRHPVARIGRDNSNDIVLANPTVSRSHAEITFNGAAFEIRNLSMNNKVIVNGRYVDHIPLRSGDIIGIGTVVINFYL